MSYHRSTRSHQDCIPPRNPAQYSCTSPPPPFARSHVPTHNLTAPMPNYPSIRTQHPLQNHPPAYSAPFFAEPKPPVERAKQSYYDYGNVDDPSTSLQNQSCDNCGYQHRCTRHMQNRPSVTPFLASCDRCLANSLPCTTNYTMNYSPHPTSFPPLAHSSSFVPNSNYERHTNNPSPRTNLHYATSEVPSVLPLRALDLSNAPSPNPNCSSRSNASKSTTASPATSHSAASSAGKEGFEPAVKRPHARGYITTLDARLSRLEAMLGELVPSAADQLKPGASKTSNAADAGKSSHEQSTNSRKSKGKAFEHPNPTPGARRDSLGIPDDPLLDGALEDALLAARPVHRDSHLGPGTLYGSSSGTGSKSIRHPLSTEIATMHLLFGNKN